MGAPEEYADFCGHVMRMIRATAKIPVLSMLNIGCGGGKNVFNLKRECRVTGLDLSPWMLKLAAELNPECEFLQGDMRTFVLDRTFDAVLMDDAITYMASTAELRAAFRTAWRHLRPGGVMVVYPDDTKETFVQNHTIVTAANGKIKPPNIDVVFVENNYDPDSEDDHYESTIVYLIREAGRLRVETDRHIHGLFALDAWRNTLMDAGFVVDEQTYSEQGKKYVTFACLKPE